MRLIDLVGEPLPEAMDREIVGLALNSREIVPGAAFIALPGSKQHGLSYIGDAVARGAAAILYDPVGSEMNIPLDSFPIPALRVDGLALRLGELAARFYGDPSQELSVIGITGTNGKTSCSQFLAQLLPNCGIIGTLGWGEWGNLRKTANTTPDALAVQNMLASLLEQKKRYVAMEVSSHGLDQGRVNGVRFRGGVLTNISHDHLDYHGSMAAYLAAKLTLFQKPNMEFAVINLDDDYSERVLEIIPANVRVWGHSRKGKKVTRGESLHAENISHELNGISFEACWKASRVAVNTALIGDFNVDNCLSVLAVLLALDVPLSDAVKQLGALLPVTGRMQPFGGCDEPKIFVDYAHTPDALEKVLSSVRQHCRNKLWVVFGCGGNRDADKRRPMGESAARWADQIIVTDDNPRYEDGQTIVDAILAGCDSEKVRVVRDRTKAIMLAVHEAAVNDWIVIAGKGHEDYQEIGGHRIPFSDAETVTAALQSRKVAGYAII